MKRKRRSVAVSSAASRKGWRTRKLMRQQVIEAQLERKAHVEQFIEQIRLTINRIPKVDWRQT